MRTLVFTILGLAALSGLVRAQTSQISGIIRDPSGSAIPGAAIKGTQTATGVTRETTSGTDGGYVFPDLPIGPYQLEVSKEGFTKYVQTGIVLQVATNPTINVSLQVGAVSEQVVVQADATQVETRTTAIGSVVTNQQVLEMPLNGRDPHELIFLAGMANFPGAGSYNSIRNYPTVVISVAGGNADGITFLLDGSMWMDPHNNLSMPLPFPDALQEFKVETSTMPAQYGFLPTATVNAVTKSGTNEYHGDLFEFVRNGDLNARDFFASARDSLKRNQFGGVIGGPVLPRFRDKLFFFAGVQKTSLRSAPTQNTAFIPTPVSLAGDFTALASPACNNGKQVMLPASLGFANNVISPALLNPVAVNIAKTLPVSTDPCGRTLYGLVANQDEYLAVGRLDWQINAKNSFFGRYSLGDLTVGSTYDGKNPLSINNYGYHDYDYGVTLGDTYLFSSNVVSSFRLGITRTNIVKLVDNYQPWSAFGANVSTLAGNVIAVAATGAFSVGGASASPGDQHSGPMPAISEDISWVKGPHQFGFGGTIYKQVHNYWSGVNAVGTASFNGQTTGLVLGDFLLGRPNTFSQGTIYGYYNRQFYDAVYAQDTWKISSRLTINYGLRWEPYLSAYNNDGEEESFDPALFAAGVRSQVFTNAPPGLIFPGDPQYTSGKYRNGPVWDKFYPRFGVAWDPQGKGQMTIRAAYGMYGYRGGNIQGATILFDAPFGNNISVSGANLTNPWANYPGGNPLVSLASLQGIGVYSHDIPFFPASTYLFSHLSDFHPMYVNQWNLSIQKQVGKGWLLTANYLGSNTIHLVSSENINPAVFLGLGPCTIQTASGPVDYPVCSTTANQQNRRLLSLANPAIGQYYSSLGFIDDGGTAEYSGLFVSAKKQMSQGVSAQANYTWSHCINDPYSSNPGSGGAAPPSDRRQFRSNCIGNDLRQQLVLNLVATTPQFSNRALRIVGSNWQVAPILEIKSAQFLSVYAGVDQALTTVASQPPNLTALNPYPSNQTIGHWINASAFATATPGSYGNLGYNNLKGPGIFQLNLALSRNFPIHERKLIQLRAEAFNLPNHLNATFGPGGSITLNSSNFGQITQDISGNNGLQAGDYRVVQLAMKFVF